MKYKQKNRMKGLSLADGALALLVLVFIVSVGAKILMTIQGTQTANAWDYNVTGQGLSAFSTFGQWFSTIAIVIVAVVIIGLIYLVQRGSSSGLGV